MTAIGLAFLGMRHKQIEMYFCLERNELDQYSNMHGYIHAASWHSYMYTIMDVDPYV